MKTRRRTVSVAERQQDDWRISRRQAAADESAVCEECRENAASHHARRCSSPQTTNPQQRST